MTRIFSKGRNGGGESDSFKQREYISLDKELGGRGPLVRTTNTIFSD